jgi:quinol monooxygenase YgiN
MFGTIFSIRPKAGMEAAVEDLFSRETQERPRPAGMIAAYLFRPTSRNGDLMGVAVFDSEASYRKNADDPEQDRWYRQLRELLEADPKWNDGDILVADMEPSAAARSR